MWIFIFSEFFWLLSILYYECWETLGKDVSSGTIDTLLLYRQVWLKAPICNLYSHSTNVEMTGPQVIVFILELYDYVISYRRSQARSYNVVVAP